MTAGAITEAFYKAVLNHKTDPGWAEKKEEAYQKNKWFTPESIDQSLDCWMESLIPANVEKWLKMYNWPKESKSGKLGIIMAGNIPLVGMHDLICGLVCGYDVYAKTSSDDAVLPQFWVSAAAKYLVSLSSRVTFTDNLKGVDAAIATGSNNSARYFEFYFRSIPHILRKNRNSVSVLTGNETPEELLALGHDVFDYFGLGCRNVTHLLLPKNYEFKQLFTIWEAFSELAHHHKYVNNYHYHKALLLMNLDPHMDTGFLLLKERNDLYSPVGMLNYSFYNSAQEAKDWLAQRAEQIQCVTSKSAEFSNIPVGSAQKTMLWDYADGVDTVEWLLKAK